MYNQPWTLSRKIVLLIAIGACVCVSNLSPSTVGVIRHKVRWQLREKRLAHTITLIGQTYFLIGIMVLDRKLYNGVSRLPPDKPPAPTRLGMSTCGPNSLTYL